MSKSYKIRLQQTLASVNITPVMPPSRTVCFAQILAILANKIIPGQA